MEKYFKAYRLDQVERSYRDGELVQKGWLAIAKLKPLVDRYSCQPIRSLDTSNNLSVGPSCM